MKVMWAPAVKVKETPHKCAVKLQGQSRHGVMVAHLAAATGGGPCILSIKS
jgi:hypothetical protein